VRLENFLEKLVENSLKIKKLKKLDFYTSRKSISRNGYVMKGKSELLTNFKWIFKMSISMVEMLQKEIQSICKSCVL
jgi:translation initiation factor 2 beta subunit (eIF-2beta)/eIF-5